MNSFYVKIREVFRYLRKWLTLGFLAGTAGGLGAVTFNFLLEETASASFSLWNSFKQLELGWLIFIIPALGGLLVGVISHKYDPGAFEIPCATDGMIKAVHLRNGYVKRRVPLVRLVTAPLTIGTGGSSGRECPMAYMGAGWSSVITEAIRTLDLPRKLGFGFTSEDSKKMAVCGTAAALGGIFRAPLGGAVFGGEVLYLQDMDLESIVPAIISSITGFFWFILFWGWEPLIKIPKFGAFTWLELVFCLLLGLVCVPIAWFYSKTFSFVHNQFRKSTLSDIFKPAIGGLICGIIVVFLPQVWGMGYEFVQGAIEYKLPLLLMACLIFGKILATSTSIGSGGSGGVMFPAMFTGAMVGGVVGGTFHGLWPSLFPSYAGYVIICMSALFSAAGKVPISCMLLLCESTANFWLVIPMLIANVTSYTFSGRITIYPAQRRFRVPLVPHLRTLAGTSILLLAALISFYLGYTI